MADPYCTPAELRTLFPVIANTATFTDDLIEGLIAEFEDIAERARGHAFVRREATEVIQAHRPGWVTLRWPIDVDVSAVTVDEVAQSLTALNPVGDDRVLSGGSWYPGQQVSVTYEHGRATLPAGCVRHTGEYVRAMALATVGEVPGNAISYQSDDGFSYRDSTADWDAGRFTGLLVVDRWLNQVPDYRIDAW